MTYLQFINLLNVNKEIQPKIKLIDGTILTVEEWEERLLLYCSEQSLNMKMTGCEITLVF